uniref:Thiamine biosynthesis protein S n=1 Tax=Vertebrata lanosa TaxID=1261582 RepID=A0A0B5W3S9_9FLOR|nr:thiamine biosynthesis protein S [Vertebrata lanosa]AJH66070.1 thiamine biosynthesis protein S [Vertebrata lanosa]
MTGFEPAYDGVTIHCRNLLATPAIFIFDSLWYYTLFYIIGLSLTSFINMQNYLTIFINGDPFNCHDSMSLSDILYYLNIDVNVVIIEYNHTIIDKDNFSTLYFDNDDSIEVISIVGGG